MPVALRPTSMTFTTACVAASNTTIVPRPPAPAGCGVGAAPPCIACAASRRLLLETNT
jgi:hypothetical protein